MVYPRDKGVPNDGSEGAGKTILEMPPHAQFWVERDTIGYGDSLDEFEIVEPETTPWSRTNESMDLRPASRGLSSGSSPRKNPRSNPLRSLPRQQ